VARLELAVDALQYLPGHYGSFFPGGMFVGQFLALVVGLVRVVQDVEIIPGHRAMRSSRTRNAKQAVIVPLYRAKPM
jgi:hypothetical protein